MIKGFEDAFTDLQSEFVSLCMEYTNGSVDKIYIYIYQDTSQKMFNAIFVKGQNVIPAGNFADDEASDEFLSIGIKDIDKLVELCDMYQCKGLMNISWSLMLLLINSMHPTVMITIPRVEYHLCRN